MTSGSSSAADSGAHRLAARLAAADAGQGSDSGVESDLARLARGVENADTAGDGDELRRREVAHETLRRVERRLERAAAAWNPGYWEYDSRRGNAWISPRLAELLDEPPSNAPQVVAAIVAELRRHAKPTPPTEAASTRGRLVDAFARLSTRSGEPLWFHVRALLDEDHSLLYGSARPLTERERIDRFALAATHSTLSRRCVLDRDGRILFVNRAWEDNLRSKQGDPAASSVGANYLEVCARAAARGDAVAAEAYVGISDVLDGRADFFELDYDCSDTVESGWQYMAATPVGDGFAGAVLRHVDITDRKRLAFELERAAYYDRLTGLPNIERLRTAIRETIRARGGNRSVALFRVGLDDLETIVEGYGHDAARAVESTLAVRLRSLETEGTALVGALGRAEFAVARIGAATDADCEEFANRLRTLAAQPVALDGSETYYPRASVGVAPATKLTADDASLRAQELFAQIALLRARSETGGGGARLR